ncbi:MAG: histone H1 [Cytophagales bacterium]|nr:histone H1 [Cytophagales bacterium]
MNRLQEQLNEIRADYQKFLNGNKTAGTRVRVAAQAMKHNLQELRLEIQESKKGS